MNSTSSKRRNRSDKRTQDVREVKSSNPDNSRIYIIAGMILVILVMVFLYELFMKKETPFLQMCENLFFVVLGFLANEFTKKNKQKSAY